MSACSAPPGFPAPSFQLVSRSSTSISASSTSEEVYWACHPSSPSSKPYTTAAVPGPPAPPVVEDPLVNVVVALVPPAPPEPPALLEVSGAGSSPLSPQAAEHTTRLRTGKYRSKACMANTPLILVGSADGQGPTEELELGSSSILQSLVERGGVLAVGNRTRVTGDERERLTRIGGSCDAGTECVPRPRQVPDVLGTQPVDEGLNEVALAVVLAEFGHDDGN